MSKGHPRSFDFAQDGRRDYYSFGGAVVAMKEGVMSSATRTLNYLHGDHLGSASLTTNISGTVVSQQRYKPYGEVRWSSGAGMPTDPSTDRITGPLRAGFTFTSQRASSYGTIFTSARAVSRVRPRRLCHQRRGQVV